MILKKVLIRGPLLTQSGYGVHARQIAAWLIDREKRVGDVRVTTQCMPWGITPWLLEASGGNDLVGEIMARSSGEGVDEPFDVTIQIQLPNEWNPKLGRLNVGVTAAVETDRCNPEWIAACNSMDLVIVPSNHTKRALTNTGGAKLTTPIEVVPEAYDPAYANEPGESDTAFIEGLFGDLETQYNFLLVGQLTGSDSSNDRKNTQDTIRWFIEATRGRKDVSLVIKTNSGKNTTIDRRLTKDRLSRVVKQARGDSQGPNVKLLHGSMTEGEMCAMYRSPKICCYVNLTRGEGFGLPILEAAVCGLPVIATDWSAHTEFLGLGKFLSVSYDLREIPKSRVDGRIFVEGTRWAQPSEEDFKRRLVKFLESPKPPQGWAADLSTKLKKAYSLEKEFANLDSIVGHMLTS